MNRDKGIKEESDVRDVKNEGTGHFMEEKQ